MPASCLKPACHDQAGCLGGRLCRAVEAVAASVELETARVDAVVRGAGPDRGQPCRRPRDGRDRPAPGFCGRADEIGAAVPVERRWQQADLAPPPAIEVLATPEDHLDEPYR